MFSTITFFAGLAQLLVEHSVEARSVIGSNPISSTEDNMPLFCWYRRRLAERQTRWLEESVGEIPYEFDSHTGDDTNRKNMRL